MCLGASEALVGGVGTHPEWTSLCAKGKRGPAWAESTLRPGRRP